MIRYENIFALRIAYSWQIFLLYEALCSKNPALAKDYVYQLVAHLEYEVRTGNAENVDLLSLVKSFPGLRSPEEG